MSDHHEAPDSGSLVASLRAKRAELEAERFTEIDIPGWEGLLVARYHAVTWETVRSFADKENPTPGEEVSTAWATLAAACHEVLSRDDDGELKSLATPGLKYEEKLARLTGDEISSTPFEVIDNLFPTEVALMTHYGMYMEWLSHSGNDVAALLGKS